MAAGVTPSPVHYRLLSEHFQLCVDLPEHEREEYLSGPSVGDPTLREELRSLLRFHARPPEASSSPKIAPSAPVRSIRTQGSRRFLILFLVLSASAVLLVFAVRAWALARLETSLKAEGMRRLQQTLDSRIALLRGWADRKKERARAVLDDPVFVSHVAALVETAQTSGGARDALRSAPSYAFITRRMSQVPEGLGENGFRIFNLAGMVLCSDADKSAEPSPQIGLPLEEFMVSRPFPDRRLGRKLDPNLVRPLSYVGGPIWGGEGQVVAFGVLFFSPERELRGLLSPPGTAEILAFDDKGLLLNNLRDPAALRKLGLLQGSPDDQTALRIHLRDPGRELTAGGRSETPSDPWPPTRMCLSATQGHSGSDSSGYRNLVGRPVMGAWAWLPEQEMGIGVEEELSAVLAPTESVRSAFVLVLAILALLLGSVFVACRPAQLRGPAGGDSPFGFYVLEGPLGQGGMGDVFLAHHSILNRPAALKILRESRVNPVTVARFKREARMASRLGHPNSIQIFDYGETSDGRLYYAMEYVEGLNVAQLITLEGALPVARSVYLLKQISGALEEAHALGLLHRDLKPSNIMVGKKGGLGDVVKILDFGIASSVSGVADDATRSTNLVGTPAYIAPERIHRPDQLDFRSDIYSFGGVAFHMLTGRSVFEGPGPAELIYQVLTSKRPSPSKLRGEPLPDALEGLILDCLAVEPESRPSSMRQISETLRSLAAPERWSQDEARAWWSTNGERVARLRG